MEVVRTVIKEVPKETIKGARAPRRVPGRSPPARLTLLAGAPCRRAEVPVEVIKEVPVEVVKYCDREVRASRFFICGAAPLSHRPPTRFAR